VSRVSKFRLGSQPGPLLELVPYRAVHSKCTAALPVDLLSTSFQAVWRSGSVVRRMNQVALRCARLVLGWVTIFGRVFHLGM